MKLIVGLGNPGKTYQATRHNIGYLVLSELANRHAVGRPKSRFHADVLDAGIGGQNVLMLCPTTYMNRSGLSVQEASRFYKTPLEDILVVCDDLNLPFGRRRVRPEGSAGGQKGLADVIRMLASDKVPRLRYGIGSPPGNMDAADYVLASFTEPEKKELQFGLKAAADAIACWVTDGIDRAMNKYNG